MKRITAAVGLLLTLFALPAWAQRGAQRSFGAEEPMRRPARIPKAVLRLLRQDERVRRCLSDAAERQKELASWFSASAVELNNDRRSDLLVKPENGCLWGANIVPFWIFRNGGAGYELVLKTHGLGVDILRKRTLGHHDVEVGAASADRSYGAVYKFDGKRYLPRRCWARSTEEGRGGKNDYYTCGDPEKPY